MKHSRGRSSGLRSRRLVGVGAAVFLVAMATGARGPTGSIEAFAKTPARIPAIDTALPEVAAAAILPVKRPTAKEQSSGLAAAAVGSLDIPAAALRAYRNAEAIMRSTSPSCGLTWEVLAGIGRVETDHGRFGGAVVGEDGVSTPQIYGVALNGVGDVAAIADSEGGSMDGDPVWDRAVGPMQFLPTTWDLVRVDGDSDGVTNPHDLDDAALGAAIYLCAGDTDLRDPEQLRSALWRYNPSEEYVTLVLSYIDAYRRGDAVPVADTTTVPTGPTSPADPLSNPTDSSTNPTGPSVNPTDPLSNPTDSTPDAPAVPPNHQDDDLVDNPNLPSNPPTQPPSNPPTQPPSNPPTQPPTQPPSNPPTQPPEQPTEPPEQPTEPTPTPDPEPELTPLRGVLTTPDDGATWMVGDVVLDLGPADYVQQGQATDDYDADGAPEVVAKELNGLVDREVVLEVEMAEDGTAIVYTINDMAYRPADGSPAPWE